MNPFFAGALALLVPLASAAQTDDKAAAKRCSVAVLNLQGQGLSEDQAHVPGVLTDSIATELTSATDCKIVTQADIAQMLDFESQKMACGDNSASCLAEIGGALGVERVLAGTVGKLGSSFTVQMKLIDIQKAEVLGRVEFTIDDKDAGQLRSAVRNGARELYGLDVVDEPGKGNGGPASGASADGGAMTSSPFFWAGAGLLGVGSLLGVAGLGGGIWAEVQLADTKATGKADTRNLGLAAAAVGIGGGVVALVGGGLLPLAFME